MSLTQQFHLLERLCRAVDLCFDGTSPTIHAPATAAALRNILKDVTEALLNQRLKGRVFSFEALHLLLNAAMGVHLLIQRCCNANRSFESASTAHIFIKMAPILYARIASAAAMMHVIVPDWDDHVQSSDFASQISVIKATADAAAADGSSERSQLLVDVLTRSHAAPRSPVVSGELLSLSMVSMDAPILATVCTLKCSYFYFIKCSYSYFIIHRMQSAACISCRQQLILNSRYATHSAHRSVPLPSVEAITPACSPAQ